MKIVTYLNTTPDEVSQKSFNIFIGISLGNKYFTRKVIKDYLDWALSTTKEKVAILIGDKIHAINYEFRNQYSSDKALRLALRKGEEIRRIISEIVENFLPSQREKIVILQWGDIENEEHLRMRDLLLDEFQNNIKFRSEILAIIKESLPDLDSSLDLGSLASYVLNELPLFFNGITYDKTIYNLIIYPGIGKIDTLSLDLQHNIQFKGLCAKLKIRNQVGILEAYAD